MISYNLGETPENALAQGEKRGIIEVDREDLTLLGLDQVKEYLGIGHGHLYKLINSNKLRTVKIGARRLVSVKSLREFITQLENDSKENGNHGQETK
ncbi:helix-turn-helix domain-containing protein [Ruminococcaceae bacterium OttesenSCG-928-A11]|nr:helix-turn-helix domain-containing protein [Ruminococcaceae bacterium OttesenSCG-928-A11]